MKLCFAIAAVLLAGAPTRAEAPLPEMFGIGIISTAADDGTGVKIREVLPDGSAAKAVLREGLIITRVDGTLLRGKKLEECVALLRGAAGTIARLEVKNPKDGSIFHVDVAREKIPLPVRPAPAAVPKDIKINPLFPPAPPHPPAPPQPDFIR
jgi:C-terminal processing protease CtpA/Prc